MHYMNLNRKEKFDLRESEMTVYFKYFAGNAGSYYEPPEPPEVEIQTIEQGQIDITKQISADEMEEIETYIYENYEDYINSLAGDCE